MHNHVGKEEVGERAAVCAENRIEYVAYEKKKEIKMILEFPVQPDEKAERELADSLKEIYLRKLEREVKACGEKSTDFT